jgi:hypothetical protein
MYSILNLAMSESLLLLFLYTRRVLGVAYFCWGFCWANKPNGSAVMIHTLLRIDIELRMR